PGALRAAGDPALDALLVVREAAMQTTTSTPLPSAVGNCVYDTRGCQPRHLDVLELAIRAAGHGCTLALEPGAFVLRAQGGDEFARGATLAELVTLLRASAGPAALPYRMGLVVNA